MIEISIIREKIQQADSLIGQTFYDSRYTQYYTIKGRVKHNFVLQYEKRGKKVEAVTFILYLIDKKQHTLKIE